MPTTKPGSVNPDLNRPLVERFPALAEHDLPEEYRPAWDGWARLPIRSVEQLGLPAEYAERVVWARGVTSGGNALEVWTGNTAPAEHLGGFVAVERV